MLSIAGLTVDWPSDHSEFASGFISESKAEPVVKFSFPDNLLSSYSVEYADREFSRFLKTSGGEMLFADENWTDVSVYGVVKNGEYTLSLAALCSAFSFYGTVLFHASLIDINGNGILFVGPSGIGKTTQAQLWSEFKNADIINGDKAFIRVLDDGIYAYGLPWKGSSTYSLNRGVKLNAIVVLSQGDENVINKLDDTSLEKIMPHIFFPHWDKACLDKTLDTLDKIVKNVPIYALECRPDEESVKLVHNTVFG